MKEFFELKVWHYIKDKSLHIIYKVISKNFCCLKYGEKLAWCPHFLVGILSYIYQSPKYLFLSLQIYNIYIIYIYINIQLRTHV